MVAFGISHGLGQVGLGRRRPGREPGKRNSSRCAPCPELRLPELRLRKGRTLSVFPPNPPPQNLLRNRSALGPRGPPPSWGRAWDVTSGAPKVTQTELTPPHPRPSSRLPLDFCPSQTSFFPALGPNLSVPTSLSVAPAPRRSSLFGSVIYIRKSLRRGREASSQRLRVWGGGGAWPGRWCYHSGENCF